MIRAGARIVAVGLMLALHLGASHAHAQAGATERETARALVQEGRKKRTAGDLDGALDDFARAHSIMGVPTTALELGKTQAEAHKLVEARDTLLSVTRIPVEGREPAPFRKARDDAKKLASELASRIPSLRIVVTGTAADGATVKLDGNALSSASVGAPVKVNPGSHQVVVTNGELEKKVSVDVAEGENAEIGVELEAPPPPNQPAPRAREPETHVNPAVWAGLGVAAAGIIAGSVTGALAMQRYADVAPQCPDGRCPPETHSDIDEGMTLGTVSTVAFAIAGAGAVTVIVALFFPVEEEASARIELGPGGIVARGAF